MKKQKIRDYKFKLLKEKKNMLDSLKLLKKNRGDREEFSTELSLYDNHPADIGTELFMAGQTKLLKNNDENILYKVNQALDRIKDNDYGTCEECSEKIDKERLDVLPYASKCIRCEKEKINNTFLKQETNEYFTFGRSFKDESEEGYVGFDGEDSWQAVYQSNVVPNDPSFGTGDYIGLEDENELGIVEEVEKISQEYYNEQL